MNLKVAILNRPPPYVQENILMFKHQYFFFSILLTGLCLSPQFSYAELSVEPLLPTGNLSNSNLTYVPYPMKTDEKRVYSNLWYYNSPTDYDSVSYKRTGNEITVGFDYKANAGYLSFGIEQNTYEEVSTGWDNDTTDLEREYTYQGRDYTVEYIHEADNDLIIGALVNYKTRKKTRVDSANNMNTDRGTANLSYVDYSFFSKKEIGDNYSLGALISPPLDHSVDYDGDFKNNEYSVSRGFHADFAIGYQVKKYTLQVKGHIAIEQPKTLDGQQLGISVFGERLISKHLSAEGQIYLLNENEVVFEGKSAKKSETKEILLGLNYNISPFTLSLDIRVKQYTSEDVNTNRQSLVLTALYGF
ncbi:MAG: hypothetical protein MJE63_19525 [Proteobacteria bacterium]|nr:hypothetical protein [Pseudomonadota bacterium]